MEPNDFDPRAVYIAADIVIALAVCAAAALGALAAFGLVELARRIA